MNSIKLWMYKLLTSWLPESRCFGFKAALLRFAGAKVGRNVRIYSSASILGNGGLEIGDDVHIGSRVLLYPAAPAKIVLGDHVDVGPEAMVLTGSHEIDAVGDHMAGKGFSASVAVGSGSWLGARATILPGVVLPPKTVVAAGAVVTDSVQAEKSLLAGVPAALKRHY